jgi:antitoxin component YwqK of YwqJK toxin-antitoxin module
MSNFRKISLIFLTLLLSATFTIAQKKPKVDLAKKIADVTPQLLPQSPVAEKLKSDAQDRKLKGKVKSVIEDNLENGKRKRHSEEYYNENGNLIKEISFDEGYPISVTVWGYIDGNRVNVSNSIKYEESERPAPRDLMIMVSPGDNKLNPNSLKDRRYDMRYVYKYDEKGRLIEEWKYQNNGEVWGNKVYKYADNKIEELYYGQDGSQWSQTFSFLDKSGNVIERHLMSADGKVGDYQIFKYKFDTQGNIIVENAFERKVVKGKTVLQPLWTIYRTITYYP